MNGIDILHKYKVEFNTLTTINSHNSTKPIEVYQFIKTIGSQYMQFLPVVERIVDNEKLSLVAHTFNKKAEVTPWSVSSYDYGVFMTKIFDEWVKQDVGKYFVQLFDVTLANWARHPCGLCVHDNRCGKALVVEYNGDVYACDHLVYPEYFRGNILEKPIKDIVKSPIQEFFGNAKYEKLSQKCRNCKFRFACNGGCQKHRFVNYSEIEKINYFCEGYLHFFDHVAPYMDFMLNELKNNRPPSNVKKVSLIVT